VYWKPPIMPRPPALDTAAARRPPDTLAIPARTIGCLIPRRDVSGVVMGPGAVMIVMLYVRCMSKSMLMK
jgi:hypothetical protein